MDKDPEKHSKMESEKKRVKQKERAERNRQFREKQNECLKKAAAARRRRKLLRSTSVRITALLFRWTRTTEDARRTTKTRKRRKSILGKKEQPVTMSLKRGKS